MENKKKFKLQLPHVYTLAFILIIVFAILTWILPSGQFDRQLIDTAAGEREVLFYIFFIVTHLFLYVHIKYAKTRQSVPENIDKMKKRN